jgi:hypothetical protein
MTASVAVQASPITKPSGWQLHVPHLTWDRLGPLDAPAERFLVRVPNQLRSSPAQFVPGPETADPDAVRLARRTLSVILEVWARRRPARHLEGLIDPTVARYVDVVAHAFAVRNTRVARLHSMRVCQPHTDAAEVAAVCVIGQRPRALAARFERAQTGPAWRCRTIQIG